MFIKKGAMFGLDARIALAIFGALSVISGAALYSAIQQSKVVAEVVELNEINKSVEAFMLDTGVDLPKDDDLAVQPDVQFLVKTTGDSSWRGPYMPYSISDYLDNDSAGNSFFVGNNAYHVLEKSESDWIASPPSATNCSASNNCYYWAANCIDGTTEGFAKSIDEYVDSSLSAISGNLRYLTWTSGKYCIYLKGPRSFY
tara:strand:- start:211 stop:810 length:600 start_codon:yes stop_codon:yes gene_type:complete